VADAENHHALWAQRHAILGACARAGARQLRIPAWAVEPGTWQEGPLPLVVDLAPGVTLFDHAALEIEITTLLGTRVHIINAATRPPEGTVPF